MPWFSAEQCTAQNIVCFTNPGDCVSGVDFSILTAEECCKSTNRRTYTESGTEICLACPQCKWACTCRVYVFINSLYLYLICGITDKIQCYVDENCGITYTSPVTSYLALTGREECCNGQFSSWKDISTNNNDRSCKKCPPRGPPTCVRNHSRPATIKDEV